jgi:predicted transcriptional regulator
MTAGRKPTVSDYEILEIFVFSTDPFLHPTEIVDKVAIDSRQGVYKRLDDLEERGLLDSKKAGGARNFWITADGRAYVEENR